MAPAQCQRQVLIWTLPALAVLISFFWYKRKKTSLRSDPGGTTLVKSSEQVDSQSLELNCITTVNSDKVIAAIEKAKRDIETSQAIQEVVFTEDDEEENNVGKVGKIDEDCKISDESFIEEIKKVKSVDLSTPKSEKEVLYESVTVSSQLQIDQKDDNTLDRSLIVISDKCDKEVEDIVTLSDSTINISSADSSFDVKDLIEDIVEVSSDNSFSVESVPGKKNTSFKKENKSVITNRQSPDCELTDRNKDFENESVEEQICVKKVVSGLNEVKVSQSPNKNSRLTKGSTSKKRSNKKLAKTNNKGEKNCEEDKVNEKTVVNGDCNKREKTNSKNFPSSPVKTDNVKSGVNNNSNKMELACSRVEQLGHNSSSSTIDGNEAGLEQKLATLGLESSHNSEGGERDSANHSPAEVMLASPSMSNFSDAHSEGSSDSGKGCSDIPDISTPPPQTPAGGSSVAGDLIPSVYEFIIPQYMVGRLIGRHGVFLHDIRSKTHTHIFIKRHPDTTKLKICAIEGAQQDIDAALAMIRQKFPLRRFPNLTLEKVTFVNIMPSLCPLPQEQFQLQLIEGVNNDVILSSLISAGHFFLQQPMHPSYQSLCQLNLVMNTVYNSPEAPVLDTPLKDAICAAPAMGGWYRAQIIEVDEENKSADVRFLDYGGFLSLETSALRKIRGDLMLLPFQAVECLLANVIPAGGEDAEWTEEARVFVQNLTCGQILQAHISEYTETGIPLVFLYAMYCGQVVVVNQELVNNGYAESYTPPVIEE